MRNGLGQPPITTLNSLNILGHDNSIQPMLILMMRATLSFNTSYFSTQNLGWATLIIFLK